MSSSDYGTIETDNVGVGFLEGSISPATPQKLALLPQSLPPIFYIKKTSRMAG